MHIKSWRGSWITGTKANCSRSYLPLVMNSVINASLLVRHVSSNLWYFRKKTQPWLFGFRILYFFWWQSPLTVPKIHNIECRTDGYCWTTQIQYWNILRPSKRKWRHWKLKLTHKRLNLVHNVYKLIHCRINSVAEIQRVSYLESKKRKWASNEVS